MNLKKVWLTPLLAIALLFSGCATLFMSKHQKVDIVTHDPNANIQIKTPKEGNQKLHGDSVQVTLKRGQNIAIEVNAEHTKGYQGVIMPTHFGKQFKALVWMDFLIPPFVGVAIDFLNPKNRDYDDRYEFDLTQNRWRLSDSSNKEMVIDNVKIPLGYVLHYHIEYHRDPKKFQKNKENALKLYDTKKIGFLDSYVFPNPYTMNEEQNEVNVESNYALRDSLNGILIDNGFIDTTMTFFPDLNNQLFVSCYLIPGNVYSIMYKNVGYGYQAELASLWVIQNSYGEILDTLYLNSLSDIVPDPNLHKNKSAGVVSYYLDAMLKMMLNFQKSDKLNAHLNRVENSKMKPVQLNMPAPLKDKKEMMQTVVRIQNGNNYGTGTVIDTSGLILTTYANISNRYLDSLGEIFVFAEDGSKYRASLVQANKAHNLALIKVDHSFAYAAQIGEADQQEVFMEINGISYTNTPDVPRNIQPGIISSIREKDEQRLLQLNMTFNEGNEGGPVYDEAMNCQGLMVQNYFGIMTEGICFAIPASAVKRFLNIQYN